MTAEAMVDLVFPVRGDTLPEDHALLLWRALRAQLPWLDDEPEAAVLPLGGLANGPGLRYVGGRARLVLRLPERRAASADSLAGAALDAGGALAVGTPTRRGLGPARVVHAARVDFDIDDEAVFVERCRAALAERGMQAEIVCGRLRRVSGEARMIAGHPVMLYGLGAEQTMDLQRRGLGLHRKLGFGVFVPHKSVAAVGE